MYPNNRGLVDLDELIIRCSDEKAKSYISEAVACYKVGGFRQAIVATWIAVVYDFIQKLRELELTGDRNAVKRVAEFETIQRTANLSDSLAFEKKILDIAKDEFELLSDLEYKDLCRLQEDRNRCAHPSMISTDEVYQPSAELARMHIRNAIEYMLMRPPVQGKAALDRLMAETQSEYFPTDVDKAETFFRGGPLARPRESLVRNFALVLAKNLLSGNLTEKQLVQYAVALNAVRRMHRPIIEQLFSDRLNDLMQSVKDEFRVSSILFLALILDTWQYLKGDIRLLIENYIRNMPDNDVFKGISFAVGIPALKNIVVERFNKLDLEKIYGIISLYGPRAEYVDKVIELYQGAGSFNSANFIGNNLVIPLIPFFNRHNIETIVRTVRENYQVGNSFDIHEVLGAIRASNKISTEEFDNILQQYGIRRNIVEGKEQYDLL